jgi:glycosyltransferase involved in cell wall biosynthesis
VTELNGLVSVVLIFLDEADFLEEAIASVRSQTWTKWELLLVDDGSRDGSEHIARRQAAAEPARIRYLEHPGHQNRGTSASRNLGIAAGRGEFVAFLDGDDVWLPRRLERAVALLCAHPAAQMVYGTTQVWHSWAGARIRTRDSVQRHGFRGNRLVQPPELLIRYLTHRAALPTPTSLTVRREALAQAGGFVDAFRSFYDDQVFLARFCLHHAVYVSDECLDRYRQHEGSTCAMGEASGEQARARPIYLAWLESWLEEQGMRDTEVWAALEVAKTADARRAVRWRARLARLLRRAARPLARLVAPQRGAPQ